MKNKSKFQGFLDYTVPDFLGILYYTDLSKVVMKPHSFYEIENFIELKATKNNLRLSSFDNQLKIQIQAAKVAKVSELIFVTTYGVKVGKSLSNYARENGVPITHYWTQYQILNGEMITNYIPAKY
ncbi:hypothetical protein SAMN05216436_12140 [bacterium A37T11]|nr:hypothetical protein SAMN05216436_12140 [bacterium A37T11]